VTASVFENSHLVTTEQ